MPFPDAIAKALDSAAEGSGGKPSRDRYWTLAGLILAAGALLRLLAARGDFWLDEILGVMVARKAQNLVDVLWGLHSEVNHHLTTLTLLTIGPESDAFRLRLPAVAAGIGTIALAGAQALRRSRRESLLAMWLVGTSYMLVHYSSEARGYGFLCFFALAAYAVAAPGQRSWIRCLVFGAACLLGFLSHLSFAYCYAALLVWTLYDGWRRRRSFLRDALRLHWLPLAGFALLYWIDVRHLHNLSGEIFPLPAVLAETFSLAVGGPATTVAIVWALASLALWLGAVIFLYRRGDSQWVFFSLAILPAPLALILGLQRQEIYPRYFLLSVLLLLILAARWITALWDGSQRSGKPRGRMLIAGLLLGSAFGNGWHIAELCRSGRGRYTAALRDMAARTSGPALLIASDHDFRQPVLLQYFDARHVVSIPIYYLPEDLAKEKPFEWYIAHSFEQAPRPLPELSDALGNRYRLAGVYPCAGLSGWTWIIYQRAP